MGVDIADFNNDGWPDVLQVDMLPRSLERRKRVLGFATPSSVNELRSRGVRDDYSANTLQLSNGVTKDGDVVFSEIARLAGISHTDWSWSALFADFDNDGLKDIFIGNGYPKAVNDLDYMTTTTTAMRPGLRNASNRKALDNLQRLPTYETPNYVFRNAGDLTFADKSAAWGLSQVGFSYGAAYADLNNDGRLDLVVNNMDAPAFIYENVQRADEAHHWLAVRLDGLAPNRRAVGATLVLTAGGQKQHLYQSPSRGFMSSVDDRLHFGLGTRRARGQPRDLLARWSVPAAHRSRGRSPRHREAGRRHAPTSRGVRRSRRAAAGLHLARRRQRPRVQAPDALGRRLHGPAAPSVHDLATGAAHRRRRRERRRAAGRLRRRRLRRHSAALPAAEGRTASRPSPHSSRGRPTRRTRTGAPRSSTRTATGSPISTSRAAAIRSPKARRCSRTACT